MAEIYPKFISNNAIGYDLYEGKSQEKLAQAISEHITNIDKQFTGEKQPLIPRLIGLEGAWGCGKSKAMPVSAMKTRFQIAECSSLYQQGRTG